MRKQPKRNNSAAAKKARAIKKVQNKLTSKSERRGTKVALRSGGAVLLDKKTTDFLRKKKKITNPNPDAVDIYSRLEPGGA